MPYLGVGVFDKSVRHKLGWLWENARKGVPKGGRCGCNMPLQQIEGAIGKCALALA